MKLMFWCIKIRLRYLCSTYIGRVLICKAFYQSQWNQIVIIVSSEKESGTIGTAMAGPSSLKEGTASAHIDDTSSQTINDLEVAKTSEAVMDAPNVETTDGEKNLTHEKDGGNVNEVDNEEVVDNEKKAEDEGEGIDKKVEKDEISEPPPPPKLPPTRIGRPNKNDRKDIIDQADWQTMVPTKDPETKFVATVAKGNDDREQVTLYSPYIQKVFRAVIRYLLEFVYVKRN
jgi:hypothetical protein